MSSEDLGVVSDPDSFSIVSKVPDIPSICFNQESRIVLRVSPTGRLDFFNQDGKTVFTIHEDGNVEVDNILELTEASRCFWEAVNCVKDLADQYIPLK